jgi:aconitate hydratase
MANLINNGILPMTFSNPDDYDKISVLDELILEDARKQISMAPGGLPIKVINRTKELTFEVNCPISERQAAILLCGGLLNFTRQGT